MSIYDDAVMAQSAVNLGAVVRSWARHIEHLQTLGLDTEAMCSHPGNVLFAEAVHALTGYGGKFMQSYEACRLAALVEKS